MGTEVNFSGATNGKLLGHSLREVVVRDLGSMEMLAAVELL